MRRLILILEASVVVAGAAMAQTSNTGDNAAAPQLPVGQVFKQFEFPAYQDGKLKYTLFATEAKGVTLNRADTSDLKIQIYDDGAVTTTITSPRADLFVAEQRMRTKNTVQVDRIDMRATAQSCDFDVKDKKFVMRTNVKVVLKHFNLSGDGKSTPENKPVPTPAPESTPAPVPEAESAPAAVAPAPTPARSPSTSSLPITPPPAMASPGGESTPAPIPAPMPSASDATTPSANPNGNAQLTSPGTYAQTNSAPLPPSSSDSK
jgi:hypothetical protein